MKRKAILLTTIVTAAIGLAGLSSAHSNWNESPHFGGHMSGMHGYMMGPMGMNFSQPMFDLAQMRSELNLSDEQVAILSQLEASHVQMQSLMQAAIANEESGIGHGQMMSFMTENFELMESHHQLFSDFEATLTPEQAAIWNGKRAGCH